MNKAFVRESDSEDDEELEPSLKLPAGTRNYITPAGHARLKSELEHLVKRERPHIVEVVAWAGTIGGRLDPKPESILYLPPPIYGSGTQHAIPGVTTACSIVSRTAPRR